MDIKLGHQFLNKTWRFLTPALRGHGEEFVRTFNPLFKLACGIHDTLLDGSKIVLNERLIYILLDSNYQPECFNRFMAYIENQDFYVTDYCPSTEISSRKRMVVLKMPKVFHNAYDKFLQGKYSEMYTDEEIELLFSNRVKIKEYNILKKSPIALTDFVKEVNKEFKTDVSEDDMVDNEYEFLLVKKEEIFHYEGGEVYFNEIQNKSWR